MRIRTTFVAVLFMLAALAAWPAVAQNSPVPVRVAEFGMPFPAMTFQNLNEGPGGPAEIDLGLVIGKRPVIFCYWIADFCADQDIEFVLGHALYMKAIHGGKAKNDRIDSEKIARILKGGMFPYAYVYPCGMRSHRDLMRRQIKLTRERGELMSHIKNTLSQYNLPAHPKNLRYAKHREPLRTAFPDPSVQRSIDLDLAGMGEQPW